MGLVGQFHQFIANRCSGNDSHHFGIFY